MFLSEIGTGVTVNFLFLLMSDIATTIFRFLSQIGTGDLFNMCFDCNIDGTIVSFIYAYINCYYLLL